MPPLSGPVSRLLVQVGALVAISVPLSLASAADGPAAALIEKTSVEVIELIKNTTGAQREAGILRVLQTSFDLPYMGQAALGPHWNTIDEAQRGRYLKTAISAEAHAYSVRFGQYGGQTLAIGKVQPAQGVTVVDSRLHKQMASPSGSNGSARPAGPRITDVQIEGVSMIMTERSVSIPTSQATASSRPLIQELKPGSPLGRIRCARAHPDALIAPVTQST